ncbi:MAG: 16S rRNA (uracil(1498)-N(3))-methyltransferase [Hyphomicrobium sp. 32-62-53]|nr:MAG: 16S rRNA (uracil(1498)-N(3))-methyltransferase [Hyphomicrobium sp. 12-62-95]OYX99305.1 MAG: 16S rRNA (uracil(1498)-N(3))-methyltransferase [Hyphomicrobium sp. 32-62-53]
MAIHDFTSQRVYVDAPLSAGAGVACTPEQVNYLVNVLRMKAGAALLVFNGRDGEWRAVLEPVSKKAAVLWIEAQTRAQSDGPDVEYLFAPLKHARLDYMVQKATEMGVKRLRPVLTRRTIAERVNLERMRANVIEAAEQCGILRVPEVAEPQKLGAVLDAWDAARTLIFCDEGAEIANPVAALREVAIGPVAVLIGPEGGFSDEERDLIRGKAFTRPLSLGPRILRADTAAVAALAVVNATLGDWT